MAVVFIAVTPVVGSGTLGTAGAAVAQVHV
jgi:hypothetical protein